MESMLQTFLLLGRVGVTSGCVVGAIAKKIRGADHQSMCEVEIWKGLQSMGRILWCHAGFT